MPTKTTIALCWLVALGCATVPIDEEIPPNGPGHAAQAHGTEMPRVTVAIENATLGQVVRYVGRTYPVGIVLMNGLGDMPAGKTSFRNVEFDAFAGRLAKQTGCALERRPAYQFLYAPGPQYAALTNISFSNAFDPAYADLRADVELGEGMRLYTVFAWLGQILGVTVAADNAVAAAECGELALHDVSAETMLEAIMKSARVPAVRVDSTPEYIFLSSYGSANARDSLLNPDPLDPRQQELLATRVKVFLPEPLDDPLTLEVHAGAKPLRAVLPSLSRQLGILEVAERGLEDLPVNPAVFNNVSVKAAMDLLIRQWLDPGYGYQVTRDRIVIRRRAPIPARTTPPDRAS